MRGEDNPLAIRGPIGVACNQPPIGELLLLPASYLNDEYRVGHAGIIVSLAEVGNLRTIRRPARRGFAQIARLIPACELPDLTSRCIADP